MEKFTKKKIILIGFSIVLVVGFVVGSFYFGYETGRKKPYRIEVQGVSNLEKGKAQDVDFGLFWEVWKRLKEKYVDPAKTGSNQDLVYGAISGLLGSLKDPNTVFFPPSDAKKFGEDISGQFSGIGAEIGMRNDQLVIIAPLKDTPAERAGLRSGDKILKIDETQTGGITVDEAVKLIRGKESTVVALTILRNGWDKSKEIKITRGVIQVPTLDFEMKTDGIAYIHLYNFYEKSVPLFYEAVFKMAKENPRGLILDLRDNPGGYLQAAVDLAGWFLESGEVVVKEEFRSDPEQVFKAQRSGIFKNLPMVILVNQGSASASEILAGALHDNRAIKLIGKKTFGKGTVQELEELPDNSLLKITIAHWRLPGGQLIEKNGIAPDYEVDLSDEDVKNKKDPQLEKAMEILKSEISK
ncbi:S41 family peptidase [Candidatus Wolfebacteria bacterium]|nr:S41 family peptidase [Candidatus Wolfebacteria bacterium]